MRLRTPSIQPKHSAASTDSGQLMHRRPDLRLVETDNEVFCSGAVLLEPGCKVIGRLEESRHASRPLIARGARTIHISYTIVQQAWIYQVFSMAYIIYEL